MKLFFRIISIVILSPLITLFGLYFVDRLLGSFIKSQQQVISVGSVNLPPNVNVQYNTAEFNISVKINNLGFRDEERSFLKPTNTIRIITIGDSFTFGWGVNVEDSWPKILEANLKKVTKSRKIEVINLGKPGSSPEHYLEIVKNYGGKFNEDIVLIGILEGDDVAQLAKFSSIGQQDSLLTEQTRNEIIQEIEHKNKEREQIYSVMEKFWPNILQFLSRYTIFSVNKNWAAEVNTYLKRTDDEGLKRFSKIDPDIQKQFIYGRLNSALLWNVLFGSHPPALLKILDYNDTVVVDANNQLAQILQEIKKIELQYRTEILVVDIPYPIYVSKLYKDRQNDLGFDYDDTVWVSTIPFESTQKAAEKASLKFISTLNDFRKNCQNDCYYFHDGHLNKKGHAFLAQLIENSIKEKIASLSTN